MINNTLYHPIGTQLYDPYGNPLNLDAFDRLRVSNPVTLFDSKQLYDNQPLFWDDAQTSGSGTTSSHSANNATTTLSVSASTAGTRVRQTKMRFNYQPGKSMLCVMTGSLQPVASGVTKRIGMFDDQNGIGFQSVDNVVSVFQRSYATGSAVTTTVAQTSWNIDTMAGAGRSRITVNWALPQIFFLDYEWLGLGRVRLGLFINGVPYYVHEFLNANSLNTVYMSDPNLPLRYEIINSGTGAASSMACICSTVISEGGSQALGILRYDSQSTAVAATAAGTIYAVMGIRQKSGYPGTVVSIENLTMLAATPTDNYEWLLILNPTVAGTFTYADVTNSAVQTAKGATANTITGGTYIAGGFASSDTPFASDIKSALYLGRTIAGTVDTIVLAVRGITATINIYGGMTWRELS